MVLALMPKTSSGSSNSLTRVMIRTRLLSTRSVSSLSGVWKVSITPRRSADGGPPELSKYHVPKRLRFVDNEQRIEVPYQPCCNGSWSVAAGDTSTSGAERALLSISCIGLESDGGSRTPSHTLLLDGLFDGERIAGTITAADYAGAGTASETHEVGKFLCTRLFTFWGPPAPKAGEASDLPGTSNGTAPVPMAPQGFRSSVRSPHESYPGAEGYSWLDAGLARSVVGTGKGPRLHTGLHALDMRDWLIVTADTFAKELQLKRRMLASGSASRDELLQASDRSTQEPQLEVLHVLADFLPRRYPHMYRRTTTRDGRDAIEVRVGAHVDTVALDGRGDSGSAPAWAGAVETPFETASRLVQEDLILMDGSELGAASAPSDDAHAVAPTGAATLGAIAAAAPPAAAEYRAAAACVCFSFGDLPRRIRERHSMSQLHAGVGDYARDLHRPVSRGMDKLKVGMPMWRSNWTFTFTDALEPTPDRYLLNLDKRARNFPEAPVTEWDGSDGCIRRLDKWGVGNAMYLQVEYQTLRRLERHSQYVLFTVRTFLHPLREIQALPQAAGNLAAQIRMVAPMAFGAYKGLDDRRVRERVLAFLDQAVDLSASVGPQSA